MRRLPLTHHCFCHQDWHSTDPSDKNRNFTAVFLTECTKREKKKKKKEKKQPNRGGGVAEANRLCLYLLAHESMWLFLYKEARLSWRVSIYHFHLKLGAVARSSLIAPHWFERRGGLNERGDSEAI